jgi:hypothetical protein
MRQRASGLCLKKMVFYVDAEDRQANYLPVTAAVASRDLLSLEFDAGVEEDIDCDLVLPSGSEIKLSKPKQHGLKDTANPSPSGGSGKLKRKREEDMIGQSSTSFGRNQQFSREIQSFLTERFSTERISKGKYLCPPALPEPQSNIEGMRFAFTLGNSNYSHFCNLHVCQRDVQRMELALESLHFKVQKLEDATKPIFERGIDEWVKMIKDESRQLPCIALFHASCHGVEVDNENYLAPIEAEITGLRGTVKERCISLQSLLDNLITELPEGSLIIFFLDCCRDEPPDDTTKSLNLNQALNGKFAKLKLANGRRTTTFVGYATEPGMAAATTAFGSADLSPFTHAIIECLKHPDIACEDIRKWFGSVRHLVEKMTQCGMNPDYQENLIKGFFFKSEQE